MLLLWENSPLGNEETPSAHFVRDGDAGGGGETPRLCVGGGGVSSKFCLLR